MGKKKEQAVVGDRACQVPSVTVLCFSETGNVQLSGIGGEVSVFRNSLGQSEYIRVLKEAKSDLIVLVDGDRMPMGLLQAVVRQYDCLERKGIGYIVPGKRKAGLWNLRNLAGADADILNSPVLIGERSVFLKAYGGSDLANGFVAGVAYSLLKTGGVRFCGLNIEGCAKNIAVPEINKWNLRFNYALKLPFRYLFSGEFFRNFGEGKVQRDMVFRMLFLLFSCFIFLYMSIVSRDYGVTGDEFVDHRHAGYVLDYIAKGDKAALDQPKTALHLYGNSVQVVAAALIRWFNIEDYYEFRHVVGGCVGALGILFVGLMGLRWGGGLCGLLSLLLMFFTPRYFGHSMNNLKDVPFAVGYMLSLFYTVRLFDFYPLFRLRHMIGLVLGITLALGTRSGGLVLYPMIFMYAGLYYMQYYGIRNFYKFGKYARAVGRILFVLFVVFIGSYFLSILLWPFALQKPFAGVVDSLVKFTNYSVGLRTIFDGEQMMSNMLPWKYAPKYLCIGMPVVVLTGFFAYMVYMLVRKKEFSLISFFFLFAAVFPVYWVIHSHSNLYGGIRHLLFVMPPMVVIAGRFWSGIIDWCRGYLRVVPVFMFTFLLALPVSHMLRNHPGEYVYFNEFIGGLKGAYGDYETDYYFNSLKKSTDWFKENVLPGLPKDEKTTIVTQAASIMDYYFRKDTNIHVIYSRYYEKYSKDWDYAIFGNVYISSYQLKNHLFPPAGCLYAPTVDGYPMSCVLKREMKTELRGFQLEKEQKYGEAIPFFRGYCETHPQNEEVWARLGKLYYLTGQPEEAKKAFGRALGLYPDLNEALYISALMNIDTKDFSAARKYVDEMLAVNASAVDALYLKALIFYKQKQYRQAIETLNRLLSLRIDFDWAHVLAGDIFRDTGKFAQAAKMYEQARRYRDNLATVVQLADMRVRLKDYSQAESLLEGALKVQSSYYPIYKVMVRMFLQRNQLPEAGSVLKQLENINNDAELWVLRALYFERTGNRQERQRMLEQALKTDPGNAEALSMQKV